MSTSTLHVFLFVPLMPVEGIILFSFQIPNKLYENITGVVFITFKSYHTCFNFSSINKAIPVITCIKSLLN